MWNWRQKGTLPPEPIPRPRPQEHVGIPGSSARRRLFMVASALITRGMDPDQAYKTALYYAEGPGRGQPWINALTEAEGGVTAYTRES